MTAEDLLKLTIPYSAILEAAIPSAEEIEDLSRDILEIGNTWWLRDPSPFNDQYAAVVNYNGIIAYDPIALTNKVRPLLKVSKRYYIDDSYKVLNIAGIDWLNIGKNLLLLNKTALSYSIYFNLYSDGNDYNNSNVKRYIEQWWESQKKNYVYNVFSDDGILRVAAPVAEGVKYRIAHDPILNKHCYIVNNYTGQIVEINNE